MIEKLPEIQIHSCAKINEKLNEVIDWVNDVSALRVTDKQVTANLPNIDLGELAFLSKENTELKDEIERTRKALDVAVDKLKQIDKTRSGVKENLHATNGRTLNAGNIFCWTTPDDIHNTLEQITAQKRENDNE